MQTSKIPHGGIKIPGIYLSSIIIANEKNKTKLGGFTTIHTIENIPHSKTPYQLPCCQGFQHKSWGLTVAYWSDCLLQQEMDASLSLHWILIGRLTRPLYNCVVLWRVVHGAFATNWKPPWNDLYWERKFFPVPGLYLVTLTLILLWNLWALLHTTTIVAVSRIRVKTWVVDVILAIQTITNPCQ